MTPDTMIRSLRIALDGQRHDSDSDLWAGLSGALAGVPDYDDPPCKGKHPMFDYPDFDTRNGNATSEARRFFNDVQNPATAFLIYYGALELCGGCPLRGLVGRCADDMLRTDKRYSGVAGGWVWLDGQPIVSHAQQVLDREVAS